MKNFIVIDSGLTTSLSAIMIAALTGIQNEHNQNEFLKITPVQASWLGEFHNSIYGINKKYYKLHIFRRWIGFCDKTIWKCSIRNAYRYKKTHAISFKIQIHFLNEQFRTIGSEGSDASRQFFLRIRLVYIVSIK